jgi:hypothetical protein
MIFVRSFNFYFLNLSSPRFLKIDKRCRSQEQFHEARLVRITDGGFAIWLDPFGMLDSQIVVNLLPELGVGVDLVRPGNWLREGFKCWPGRLV